MAAISISDGRVRWIIEKLMESFGFPDTTIPDAVLSEEYPLSQVKRFFQPDGPSNLLFFYQVPTIQTAEGEYVVASNEPKLFFAGGDSVQFRGKAVFFIRTAEKEVNEKTIKQDVVVGEVCRAPLEGLRTLMMDLFLPVLREQLAWGKSTEENVHEFLANVTKFGFALNEAVNSLHGGVELKKADKKWLEFVELKPSSFTKAAADSEILDHVEQVLDDWCTQTEKLLSEGEMARKEPDDVGPDTELEFWRRRLAKLNSITEQLKSKECKLVLGVTQAARSKAYRSWKQIDLRVTDAANEAKDNVKYLTTLEKSLEPMYLGTPQTIIESLPVLMSNIKMMHSIARYYNTAERMTVLFVKVTNQMITKCKEFIKGPGKLWEQDKASLIQNLELCIRLNEQYQEQYRQTRDKLQSQAKGKQFDFNEQRIFHKFDVFCKRLTKLVDMFTTVHQFGSLEQHSHIEGLGEMIKTFFSIVEDFKKKPYDLLDFSKNQFDRDYLEFNVNIHDLETTLQGFINSSFENITSTEHALNLLRLFQAILQRDSLKGDLDDKYMVIFQNYGLDLEAIQKIYEKYKHNPPLVRNAPPVAGNIMWARQLLRRIEDPMKRFAGNKSIMATKESKRIIRMYNKVARALVEFELLWHQAWLKNIDAMKAGLQATLIVKHPENGNLLVNFDKDILQLMRETKFLQRMHIEVPEAAKMVLLQEDKFKYYFNQLTYVLKEYERVMHNIRSVTRPLLGPHLDDLDKKIHPGMYILTWTSMNIDGYLQRIYTGLQRLEELVRKMNDMVDNRIEANLKGISKTSLIDLPPDHSFTFDDFVSTQSRFIKRQTETMEVKNLEVERAVNDLIELVATNPRENMDVHIPDAEMAKFKNHYSKLMYQAILTATKNTFVALRRRLGSRVSHASTGLLPSAEIPFFEVDVELTIPNVSMNPSLDDIQNAINTAAKKVLRCSAELKAWNAVRSTSDIPGATFYDLIAADKEIVKSVLLLTGSIEGTKQQVVDYIRKFDKYDFLWKRDMQAEYAEFMRTGPNLEAFENELQKYMAIETEIANIPAVHHIGALSLETQPMKYSLKAEAASWKAQFAKNLHHQAYEDLKVFHVYIKETTSKLNVQIKDLEDVRIAMAVLKEVREKEAEIESIMTPIEDMYSLLHKYEVRIPKEENEQLGDLRVNWKKMRKLATDVSDNLARLQIGFKRDLVKEVKTFVVDVGQFRTDFEQNGPMQPGIAAQEAVDRLRKYQQMFEVRKHKWATYSAGEELFGLAVTSYPDMEKMEKELGLLDRLYSLYTNVISTISGYADIYWVEVVSNIDAMQEEVLAFQHTCKKLPRGLRGWEAYTVCKKTIDDFLEVLPLLQLLSSKAMRNRHWQQLMQVCNKQLNLAEDIMKLSHLFESNLLAHREEIEELCNAATREEQVELKLAQIADEWAEQVFTFNSYKNRGQVVLKSAETAEIVEKLEDSQLALGSMAANRYSSPFREELNSWIVKLSSVSEIIEMWLQVQNMWMYMESVFSGGDIAKQLPQEAKRFQNIDKNYMKIVNNTSEVRNVIQSCFGNELMKNLLPHLIEQLELCQKSLATYLETKRAEFPRFYFVSDPTLLEILSMGSDPQAVQPHFQSGLFDAIAAVTFDRFDKSKILEMHSVQGEIVKLEEPVIAVGNIEDWLKKLVAGMQSTVKKIIKRAYDEVNVIPIGEFVFKYPAQAVLIGLQFLWTADSQIALASVKSDKSSMNKVMKKFDAILRELVDITTRDLGKNERTNIETMVTVHVNQRDTFEDLLRKKVKDPMDFEWLKQCRIYWREDIDGILISIADVDFEYSFEYLGVKERLVALGMFLGGAPAGPAGTGKTETTKDLGATLGKYVVVFNCSDQMDYKGMGKIFKGLAQSGLWGCFDEFNRINLDVLSVCAQQLFCILSAVRERKPSFVFTDGTVTPLDARAGFFVTMNPGYAGRQELPENLKSLFRGVTMMVPNRQIIIKVKLASCGYQDNDILAKKFFVLYGLCEQQLSKQPHYDFGLRNILSVLRTAGGQKRENAGKSEQFLMMRTLRDLNLSKFVAEDVPLFLSLIEDLFPGIIAEKATFKDVEDALLRQVKEKTLQPHPSWLEKCVQLYETYLVRHGIMLVGPTGGGKTMICTCLAGALSEVTIKHVIWRMNPKSITTPQMFGRLDTATGDWTDGVFSVLWRKAARSKNQNTWIVLDGPVDTFWIESLNSVLDDNKLLTLANGDRIPMIPNMKAMVETEHLANASPATVSRCGIIYVSETELGWEPVVASWLEDRKPAEVALLKPLFDKYVPAMLTFVRLEVKEVMKNQPVCQVNTLLILLNACLQKAAERSTEALAEDQCERIFLYVLTWSIGGLLNLSDRSKFDKKLRGITENMPDVEEGSDDTIFEYRIGAEQATWEHWKDHVPDWKYPAKVKEPKLSQLLIPTLDSIRLEALIELVVLDMKATLFVGGPGTAKTVTVNQYLSKLNLDEMNHKSISFSSLTTPKIFQSSVEGVVEKRQGRTFGPPGGKRMVLFIDDLSMPAFNEWGDQVTNEIVRQLLEQGGFYSLERPGDLKKIVDVLYLAAMNEPTGGKNDVPSRLKRHFACFNVPMPSMIAIKSIYGTLVAGRFPPDMFTDSVIEVVNGLVGITVTLWNTIATKMLPTPAKFHYIFNMRDLSRVFQGILHAERDRFHKDSTKPFAGQVTTKEGYLLALWRHECERVFGDKLTTPADKDWVTLTILALSTETFGAALTTEISEPLYFVDFLRDVEEDQDGYVIDEHPKNYETVRDLTELRERVEALQRKMNNENKAGKVELVLFEDALKHIARITRVLGVDHGCALLVGVGGSGKQSLTRLAAYISGAYPVQLTITKTYSIPNLLDDIKGMYKVAGFKGQAVAFIFSDTEVKEESFLEYVNQMLMTGEVSGLFPKDEIDMIINDMRTVMRAASPTTPDTYDNLYRFFMDRVRDNLHIILCFSPVGVKFSQRALQFPGLINGCTIDWFLPWPVQALKGVAAKFISSFQMESTQKVKEELIDHMAYVHNTVTAVCSDYFDKYRRHVYVTPKSYLSFINGFKSLYSKKYSEIKELSDKIVNGLGKLNQAKTDVRRMKVELAAKHVSLAEAQKVSETLLKEISASTAMAEKEKARVAGIQSKAKSMADEIGKTKAEAEEDLAAAKPALDDAIAALSLITGRDISTLKQLKKPPDIIKRIMDSCLLLKHQPINRVEYEDLKGEMVIVSTYSQSLVMMSDIRFLDSLTNFPKEQINDETVELLQPYFMASDFTYEAAKKASGNVAGLCSWTRAMCAYHEIAKVVEPKIQKLRDSEQQFKVATKKLQEAEESMAKVQAELDKMQAQFEAAMKEKRKLEEDADKTQKRMDAANSLINALAGEEVRWTSQSHEFAATIQQLTGDCALASSFVSYAGTFNKEFRETLINREFFKDIFNRNIPATQGLGVTKFLVDDSEASEWKLQGLPTDELSVQNGILVTHATRFPLMVDPQGQGLVWIKRREAVNNIKVTTLNDKSFRSHLDECLSTGRPMLIENVEEELDPVLDPVLEKRWQKAGKGLKVALVDKEVDFKPSFQLFMTTRLANPHLTPELSAKVTVIDFTVTMAGLEDQLLGRLILKEKHDLEEQRRKLLEEVTSYKKKIKQLEDDLLYRLSASTGNLLDDTELVEVLAVTKQTAQDVNERLATATETNKKITEACEEYRPVAKRATIVYFLIAEFSNVNVMYQTSLKRFGQLYEYAIDHSEKAVMPSKRIHNIVEYLTFSVYRYILRGLFERDRVTFALMLAMKLLLADRKLSENEVSTFLKGGAALDIHTVRRKPREWILDSVWLNAIAVTNLVQFQDLVDSLIRNDAAWKQWYDQEAPEASKVPDYEDRLSKFDKMLLVKTFREDRTLLAASEFISESLGARYMESIPLSMENTWQDSDNKTPIICILSPGADPTKQIEDFAKKKKFKVLGVSMGQGQEIIARKYMATAVQEGNWVLLQNTHLGLGYLSEVEQFVTKTEEMHDDFRIWITAEPHPRFPIGLLHVSIKMTNEAPVGMKAGLRNSFQWLTQDMLEAVPRPEWRQLLFVMCFLHSIVQERRKFCPIGWNVPYEFNQSDLSASVQFLENHLMDMDAKKSSHIHIAWTTVRYMVAEIQYGGRITDDFDRILMNAFAEQYFHQGILEKNCQLFPGYVVPYATEIAIFRTAIEALPPHESPELFGMHANAELTYRTLQVKEVIRTIIDTQPKTATAGAGMSREDMVDKIAEDLLAKMPAAFKVEETKDKLKKLPGNVTAPLNVHLKQEIDRLNLVISMAESNLQNLRLAIKGSIALSTALKDTLDALHDARPPKLWIPKSWEASTLGSWFTGLIQRHDQLTKWLNLGRPKAFWLTGFFNPQGFLTAMKQEVNRKHAAEKWALDDVIMYSEVTHPVKELENLKEGPAEGVYIYGLFVEGCAWSNKENRLVDSEPKKLFHPLPILYVTGVLASQKKGDQTYSAPTYRVKRRTSNTFITTFDLRTEDSPSKWILRGAAVLCAID
ncbi:hypothetical protein CBR_g23890 [Chara braunii]|uniref:AAA+ ATPase domain-containing protein n=1 Tax=Chara braunii TaxID=69332 RepID=A0A388L558_CHABU|nr:hypothetical protein CBR_g23890 [Chara braunii]|eukprot:GBG77441.1 hypothetical protein CBR_g23890 [Chara braunii]